jgi:flagellar hook protein FlgE
VVYTRSGAATTSNPFDVYIDGDGFIAVKTADGQARYTRAGVLGLDKEGNLVDRNGNLVLGLPLKDVTLPSGQTEKMPALDSAGKATITDLVTIRLDPSVEYTGIEISTKGEVTALRPGAALYTPGPNTSWFVTAPFGGAGASPLSPTTDLSGDVRITVERDATTGDYTCTAIYGFDKTNKVVLMGTPGSPDNTEIQFTVDQAKLDEYMKTLAGIEKGEKRDITIGNVAPGTSTPELLGQLAVVTFENQAGLSQEGQNYYAETINSGSAEAYVPGRSGTGQIMAGALELSNVDLSREFTEMIITERGFQANTRMVTVSDEMLQELINMKR